MEAIKALGGHAGREPQAHPAAHGYYGNRSPLSEIGFEPPGTEPRDLPLPAARDLDRASPPSHFVLSWELSNTMETSFCLAALEAAFRFGQREIWNGGQSISGQIS